MHNILQCDYCVSVAVPVQGHAIDIALDALQQLMEYGSLC